MSTMNRKKLKSQAGAAAFGRGEGYFESGHVGTLRFHKHGVQAKVSGSHLYQVRLEEYLAELYVQQKAFSKAVNLVWKLFERWVQEIRLRHKPKRNLMKLMLGNHL